MLRDEMECYIDNINIDDLVKQNVKPKNKKVKFFVFIIFTVCIYIMATNSNIKNSIVSKNNSTDIMYNQVFGESVSKTENLSIPTQVVNQNPFLPYRNLGPTEYNRISEDLLVAPPEILEEASTAVRIMNTTVSGILYDKYNSSAILNIEGTDYFVKKGDIVNNYKVLDIKKDSVTVKLEGNIYTAGIGEILTEGTITHNNISNLNKKFGGDK